LLVFLAGKFVCVPENTTSHQNLQGPGGGFTIVPTAGPSYIAYDNGACDAMSTDKSALVGQKDLLEARDPDDQLIFGVTISKEPLGLVTTYGDQQWSDIVDWVVYATFFAEEHGITQANVGDFEPSTSEEERFLGDSGDFGAALGLSQDWAKEVIGAVGNYGEIYERNLVPVGIARTQQNRSHVDGGLLFAPPFR
jgi:general L-amino acid transport system substrate-binding protein